MSHNYNYRVGGTALVGTGKAKAVRLIEGLAGRRAEMLDIAYQHGVYVAERHWTRARLARLEILLPGEAASEPYVAVQAINRLMCNGLPYLQRDDPNAGEVRTKILAAETIDQPDGADRFYWPWPVWMLNGYWEQTTANDDDDASLTTTGTLGPFAIGGDHPTEPVFTIDCVSDGANPQIEEQTSGDTYLLATSFTAGEQIIIDTPSRTVTVDAVRAKNILKINRGHWMEFPAGANATLDWTADSGTWDVNTAWRNRWR